jgi:hypothetical protein
MAKQEIPQARRRDITYGRIVCNYCPKKNDPHRMRIMMGGNLINYPGNCGTPTISIKDFYLMMPMDCYEYFRMKLELFPQDIINECALHDKVDADGNFFL